MPLYEYQCDGCDRRFEVIQKFSDAPLDTCEQCGGTLRKLPSSPAIQFKGSGWYITDYARAGTPGDGKATGGDAGASADGKKTGKDGEGEKSGGTAGSGASASGPDAAKGGKAESAKSESKTAAKSSGTGTPRTS